MPDQDLTEVKEQLVALLGGDAVINVQPDPYRGIALTVVAARFSDMTPGDRRDLVFSVISDDSIGRLELLSPEDAQFLGVSTDTTASEVELPLWPESLVRGEVPQQQVRFPSLTDTPLSAPVVATFYSLRGGVGRSTALAHTATVLSRQNTRVLCVDMDLEAPGLASLFGVENLVKSGTGVVPVLLQTEISGRVPDLDEHIIQVGETPNLYLLPAGRPDADYARQLSQLEPSAWYRESVNPLRLLMDAIAGLPWRPQVVLIDSRTGISPISAPLLFHVADIAIITFFPHPQAQQGTRGLTRALLAAHTARSTNTEKVTPELRFIVSPVPATPEVRQRYEDRAIEWISEWLAPARTAEDKKAFDALEEIIQVVSYSEEIAASDTVLDSLRSTTYGPIAGWIAGFVDTSLDLGRPRSQAAASLLPTKADILDSLRFSTGKAEDQPEEVFRATFLRTDITARALSPEVPLVLGRKGTGKTAIFRELASQSNAVVVTSPDGLDTRKRWMPDAGFYNSADNLLSERGCGWRTFWALLIGISLRLDHPELPRSDWTTGPLIFESSTTDTYNRTHLLRDMRALLEHRDVQLLASEWLQSVDDELPAPVQLLFDGLDTGFGGRPEEIERRQATVSGLVELLLSKGNDLTNTWFKILIRDDIWRSVSAPNKSHLFGQAARLSWANQTDYLRVSVKQAIRSLPFRALIVDKLGRNGLDLEQTAVEFWPESVVYAAWEQLVGERVSGGKTAFTYNWAWSRLADANDNHSPRALIQLFNRATQLEREIELTNPYSRSILRPRAMVESLDVVSEQALEALKEEFQEPLSPLFIELERIGTTPFDASELRVDAGIEELGREVGLLGVAAGSRDDVERYRVPELYRKALGMSRRGQA